MPVVTLYYYRIQKMLGKKVPKEKIIATLPFIGLDIEEETSDHINVEYSPNRPDYSTDYGIIAGLQGLLGIKQGMSKLKLKKSIDVIKIDSSVSKVRPYVMAIEARYGLLNNETIRQLITMQEDLHNGICRRRRKASIGIHDLEKIRFPLYYKTVNRNHSFLPLGSESEMMINEILEKTETGKKYHHLLGNSKVPVIIDSTGKTISLPPIINAKFTEINNNTKNLLVEVTATDKKTAEDTLAIIANILQIACFQIFSVKISGLNNSTPTLKPRNLLLDPALVNKTLGLDLSNSAIIKSLKKCRLDAKIRGKKIMCIVPRYRTDIFGEMDLVEEVALGYGIQNLTPTIPQSIFAGEKNYVTKVLRAIRQIMIGLDYSEVMNFELTGKEILYDKTNRTSSQMISVTDSKSQEHVILRDMLLPGMLDVLSRNIHESYPQKIFEIGTVFEKNSPIKEEIHLSCMSAHKDVNFSEIKSILQSFLKTSFNLNCDTVSNKETLLTDGRSADIIINNKKIGIIGEINGHVIDKFKLRIPVAGFEIKLTGFIFD